MKPMDVINKMVAGDWEYPARYDSHITVAYILCHEVSGKFYAGVASNMFACLKSLRYNLKRGFYNGTAMREAYALDSSFDLYYKECGDIDEAYQIKQEIVDKYLPLGLLLNVSKDARTAVTGVPCSDDRKDHLSQAHIERFANTESGIKHKEKLSRVMSRRWADDAWKKKTLATLHDAGRKPEVVEKIRKTMAKELIINGMSFSTMVEAAAYFGIHPNVLAKRVKNGFPGWEITVTKNRPYYYTRPDLINKPAAPKAKKQKIEKGRAQNAVTINGVRYDNTRAAATALGIAYANVWSRLKTGYAGWSSVIHCATPEETEATRREKPDAETYKQLMAAETSKRSSQPVIVNGKTYPSAKAAAAAMGWSTWKYNELRKQGFPGYRVTFPEKERSTKKLPKGKAAFYEAVSKPITINGVAYPNIRAAADGMMMSSSAFYRRRDLGFPGWEVSYPEKKKK